MVQGGTMPAVTEVGGVQSMLRRSNFEKHSVKCINKSEKGRQTAQQKVSNTAWYIGHGNAGCQAPSSSP